MSQVQNTCSEEPASYRLLGADVTASYRLLGASVTAPYLLASSNVIEFQYSSSVTVQEYPKPIQNGETIKSKRCVDCNKHASCLRRQNLCPDLGKRFAPQIGQMQSSWKREMQLQRGLRTTRCGLRALSRRRGWRCSYGGRGGRQTRPAAVFDYLPFLPFRRWWWRKSLQGRPELDRQG